MVHKDDVARLLAHAHREIEPTISLIIRLVSEREEDASEPVKLLEVNAATSPSGICPIAFTAHPPDVPHPSVVVEVTEEEYDRILSGDLGLPDGWELGDTLYPTAA